MKFILDKYDCNFGLFVIAAPTTQDFVELTFLLIYAVRGLTIRQWIDLLFQYIQQRVIVNCWYSIK